MFLVWRQGAEKIPKNEGPTAFNEEVLKRQGLLGVKNVYEVFFLLAVHRFISNCFRSFASIAQNWTRSIAQFVEFGDRQVK